MVAKCNKNLSGLLALCPFFLCLSVQCLGQLLSLSFCDYFMLRVQTSTQLAYIAFSMPLCPFHFLPTTWDTKVPIHFLNKHALTGTIRYLIFQKTLLRELCHYRVPVYSLFVYNPVGFFHFCSFPCQSLNKGFFFFNQSFRKGFEIRILWCISYSYCRCYFLFLFLCYWFTCF